MKSAMKMVLLGRGCRIWRVHDESGNLAWRRGWDSNPIGFNGICKL